MLKTSVLPLRVALGPALLCLLALALPEGSRAQAPPSPAFGFGGPSMLEQLRQRALVSAGSTTPLEGAIDPGTYVVGPGDAFNITVGGPEPLSVTATVTADGFLVLPESESVRAAGMKLGEVRERVRASLREQYQNVGLEVALAQPRQFKVHVSGAVPVPGRYTVTPIARASDAIGLAFSDTTQPPVANAAYRPSLRSVTLRRKDGTRRSLDLLRYFATGDVDHNPYLQDGDVVYVHAFDPDYRAVFIDGAIPFPGTYAYREGDTVADLLMLAGGGSAPVAPDEVRLTRRDGGEELLISADRLAGGEAIPVEPLDHLYIIPERLLGGTATVSGAVRFPGTYPITLGETTLQDLVRLAGGPREDALERAVVLQRLPAIDADLTLAGASRFGRAFPDGLPQSDAAAVLQRTRLAELDFTSRAYFAQELSQPGGVPIDLEVVMAPEAEPVYLQDGDRLRVPRDERTVLVLGQVVRPGYAAFVPDWPAERYIEASGGRGPEASDAYLVKAGTGRFLALGTGEVESGDVVFVDRREGVADTPEMQRLLLEVQRTRADARSRTAQIIFGTIATTASVITTYLFIRDRQ